MSRILIWRQVVSGSDIDIFSNTDYSQLDSTLKKLYNGACPNWGNKLWFQGLYSEIDTPENEVHTRTNETADQINANYDLIIYPMANFFSVEYASDTAVHVEMFSHIKIPIYVIACGAQAETYGDIEGLIHKIGTPSSRFIEAIYRTGGEFALRGNFTKEFFDRLGFSSAVVTGCPSMYQLGAGFRVNVTKVSREEIKPIITGKLNYFEDIMKSIPESIYLDQETYAACLYRKGFLANSNLKSDILFSFNYSVYQAELLGQGRIKMIVDMNDWYQYIRNHRFNFAFGTKIHGSIMPILAGVPAVLVAIDSRTMEMAEFFDIPYVEFDYRRPYSLDNFYAAYEEIDYEKFNQHYEERFRFYEDFLIQHKIVKKINENNRFFANKGKEEFDEFTPNRADFEKYAKKLKREEPLLKLGKKVIQIKNNKR